MRSRLPIAVAMMSLLVVPPGIASIDPVATQAKTGNAVSCKGAKVPVTVGKRTTCRPLAKAIPKPKQVDLRLAYLQQTLKFDPAKAVRGRKGKRARTLQSGFGAAGRRAQKKILKLLPKALAFVDRRKRGGRSSSLRPPGLALASAGCQPGPAGPTGQTGGATIGALGDNGGYIDAPVGGGMRVRVTFASCGGVNNLRIPACPTANGDVDGSGSGEFRATIEIWDGDQLQSRNSSTFDGRVKVHGEVGDDAKLRAVEVEHTEDVFIVASGGIVIRGGVTRIVRIAMPGGRYEPGTASVRFFGDPISGDMGADSFAGTVDTAIKSFRRQEEHWNQPNNCAKIDFAPPSNSMKLKRGASGPLTARVDAKDGGSPSTATWTMSAQENATFAPSSGSANPLNPTYTVTKSGPGILVKGTFKAVSKAGVAEGSWVQETESDLINQIKGTFTYEVNEVGSVLSWSGDATFDRSTPGFGATGVYELSSGTAEVVASGKALGPACQWKGSDQFKLNTGDVMAVVGQSPEALEPYLYTASIYLANADVEGITLHSCSDPEDEGDSIEVSATLDLFLFQETSEDGVEYSGSSFESESGISVAQSWSFTGSP